MIKSTNYFVKVSLAMRSLCSGMVFISFNKSKFHKIIFKFNLKANFSLECFEHF